MRDELIDETKKKLIMHMKKIAMIAGHIGRLGKWTPVHVSFFVSSLSFALSMKDCEW